jgi:hypothetical protein
MSAAAYDLYARVLAPYLKRHIASHPNVIVQNMPGAGGMRMANYMAANAKTDGSVIGLTLSAGGPQPAHAAGPGQIRRQRVRLDRNDRRADQCALRRRGENAGAID